MSTTHLTYSLESACKMAIRLKPGDRILKVGPRTGRDVLFEVRPDGSLMRLSEGELHERAQVDS